MIKDLLGFLDGTVFKINQTATKIILNNGHEYNAKLFHQSLGIVRIMLNQESNTPEYQAYKEAANLRTAQLIAQATLEFKKVEEETTQRLINLQSNFKSDLNLLMNNPIKIGFGKYRGRFTNEIGDAAYLNWALGVREVEKISNNY